MRSSMSAGVTEYLGAIDTKFVSGTNLSERDQSLYYIVLTSLLKCLVCKDFR